MAHELRRYLPRTFAAFLGGFDAPTPIQSRAIPGLSAGRDALLAAPTASGKTEAYAAPAAERLLAEGPSPGAALFVSPTRALANDLMRRLEGRFDRVGLRLRRYTGEHKELVGGGLAEVTVTTPEALDSLLARRPASLRGVRVVVLDEIHVVDGTARGDQLRILLHRLQLAARRRPQRVAASATVEAPDEVARRYLDSPAVFVVEGNRAIRAKAFPGANAEALVHHVTALADHGFRKILVFCNRRADVELHAERLRGRTPYGDLVFAHHGSLARRERERTERLFLDAPTGVVVATMTLEMGIDVGSIDYVLLAAPPPGVASLLQRIGRGSRRTGTVRAGYAAADPGQRLVHRTLLAAAARGELLGQAYAFRPSVVLQQALVVAGSQSWIDAARLQQAVPGFVWEALAPAGPGALLDALADDGKLERVGAGRYVLAEATEHRYDYGALHSNIDEELVLDLVDRITGDVVGHVPPQAQRRLRLGGRVRRVVGTSERRLLSDAAAGGGPPVFHPRGVPYVTPAFAQRVVEALTGARDRTVQAPADGAVVLLHGLGTAGAMLLERLLADGHGKGFVRAATPFVAWLDEPLEALPAVDAEALGGFVERHAKALAKLCAMGPWHRLLPAELAHRAVRQASGLDEVAALLAAKPLATWRDPDPELQRCAVHL